MRIDYNNKESDKNILSLINKYLFVSRIMIFHLWGNRLSKDKKYYTYQIKGIDNFIIIDKYTIIY